MKAIGFTKFLGDDHDGYIITSFLYPKHPNFHFNEFYERLLAKGETRNASAVTYCFLARFVVRRTSDLPW